MHRGSALLIASPVPPISAHLIHPFLPLMSGILNAFTVSMANAVSLEPHRMFPTRCVHLLIRHQSACALKMSSWETWGSLRMHRFWGSSSLQTWYLGMGVHPKRKRIKSQGPYLNSMYSDVFSHSQREVGSVGRSWATSLRTTQV